MEHYVGLDVSLKLTAICIVDRTGKIVREGVVASDPEIIATFIKSHAPHVARVGLETGATTTWLWTELNKMGLPIICIDARHAKAALKLQINKSDRNDAVGIARIMQCSRFTWPNLRGSGQSQLLLKRLRLDKSLAFRCEARFARCELMPAPARLARVGSQQVPPTGRSSDAVRRPRHRCCARPHKAGVAKVWPRTDEDGTTTIASSCICCCC